MKIITLCLWLFALPAFAQSTTNEARAHALFLQLRCVVCESMSIADSKTQVADDMRTAVRAQMAAGKSDDEILEYMTAQYGNSALMTPPLTREHAALWITPLVMLLMGIGVLFRLFRKKGGWWIVDSE